MGKTRMQPIILCGGSGSRLAPISTQACPKAFLKLLDPAHDMLSITAARFTDKPEQYTAPFALCTPQTRDLVPANMPKIIEPAQRNTAAAIVFAAMELQAKGRGDATTIFAPSDHVISNISAFHAAMRQAQNLVETQQRIVIIGINADKPDINKGYIQSNQHGEIIRFIEKPTLNEAKNLHKSSDIYWNAGIFIATPHSIIGEAQKLCPEIIAACRSTPAYDALLSTPFDKAILEKTQHLSLVPAEMGWHDIGTWDSLHALGNQYAHIKEKLRHDPRKTS